MQKYFNLKVVESQQNSCTSALGYLKQSQGLPKSKHVSPVL